MLPTRLKLALTVAVACAAALVLAVVLAQRSDTSQANGAEGPLVFGFYGTQSPPSVPPQDFTLTDQNGRRVSLSGYAGKVVILTFLYSTCETTCPVVAQQIRGALDDLGQPVPAVAVSVDPKNDTQLNIDRFLVKESLAGRMEYLSGTRAQLQPIWNAYGIQPQTVDSNTNSDHSAAVLLIDKSGRQRIEFPDSALTPEALAHDVKKLEDEPAPAHRPPREQL
jgi:protein SCO1/2